MQIDAGTISVAVAVIALLYTAMNFKRTTMKDKSEFTAAYATLKNDVAHIRTTTDEIKNAVREVSTDVSMLRAKIAEIEKSVDFAHKRIDEIQKG